MSRKKEKEEPLPQVELSDESQHLLKSTESTASSIHEDLETVGDNVDISKMTLEQVKELVLKLVKNHNDFKYEIRKTIQLEIEKQVKPLAEQIELLTTQNPRFVYIKFKIPLLDFFKNLFGKLKK